MCIRDRREAAKRIADSQMIFLPGGFSGGDEPEGSAKFIAAFFRNPALTDAVHDLLKHRDGLMLGICNEMCIRASPCTARAAAPARSSRSSTPRRRTSSSACPTPASDVYKRQVFFATDTPSMAPSPQSYSCGV